MRGLQGFSGAVLVVLCAGVAQADPVTIKPDNCDFGFTFPAAPTQSQTKSKTSRGDDVVTNRADLRADLGGKTNFFRIECTKIPRQGQMDEEILRQNMKDLAASYKLDGANVSVDHNAATGAVGHIQGHATLGGKAVTLRIDRYTSANDILDVWTGAEPDAFPSDAGTAFLKAMTFNGQTLP
jgi:hypothetical protein